MFISADQLLAHAIGDYVLQSHWMAVNKTKSSWAALYHAAAYSVPFWFLTTSPWALWVICVSHFALDRWRLARFVVGVKNLMFVGSQAAFNQTLETMDITTGYPKDCPPWLATWLLIIADNILHVICNGLALKYL